MRWTRAAMLTVVIVIATSCSISSTSADGQAAIESVSNDDTTIQSSPADSAPAPVAGVTAVADAENGSADDNAIEGDQGDAKENDDDAHDVVVSDGTESAGELDPDDMVLARRAASLVRVELDLAPAQPGDDGSQVVDLQGRLNDIGFAAGMPDGDYGRRTERAVASFQQVNGLEPTGIVDDATIEALRGYRYAGLRLGSGDENDDVEALQKLLIDAHFDPGTPDGVYGTKTVQSVWALEKMAGIPMDGDWGPADDWAYRELVSGAFGAPTHSHDTRWVEVDLSQQVMKVYDPGGSRPVLISHISSGSGVPWENENHRGSSITPKGDFAIQRRISGWRESSLDIGRLYNPLYFVGGIAFHGAQSVPSYPASHGCVRLPMHIAEYLPGELPNGTPVHVMS